MSGFSPLDPVPASAALAARLGEECDRYGLPHSLDALLRHIYGNRDAAMGAKDVSIRILTEQRDEARADLERGGAKLPRTRDFRYDLTQRLDRAVRWLRDAEDIARIERPALPVADRIRDIYEQVSEDLLNGKLNVPPLRERLATAEAEIARLNREIEGWKEELRYASGQAEDDDG